MYHGKTVDEWKTYGINARENVETKMYDACKLNSMKSTNNV